MSLYGEIAFFMGKGGTTKLLYNWFNLIRWATLYAFPLYVVAFLFYDLKKKKG